MEDEMNVACSTHEGYEKCVTNCNYKTGAKAVE